MIKNLFAVMMILLSYTGVSAQAKPAYSQYVLNNYILNPALTGIENYTDIKLSHRRQWTGFDGAPVVSYVTVQGPIGKTDHTTSATSFQVPGVNPRGKEFWDSYTAPDPHHGIGFSAVSDKAGYINRYTISASYAYHRPLSQKTTLAAGFSVGVSGISLDRDKVTYGNLDNYDPAIGVASGELKKYKPELGVGLWLYSARYFAGVSILNIVPGKAKFTDDDKYGTYYTPNGFLTLGYRVAVGEDFSLIPSVMVQYWQPQLLGAHLNAKLQYRDAAWIGAGYRYSDFISGYSALAGFNVSNTFNVSYSYEVSTTSRLRTYTGNTHEIMIGFILGNKYGDGCPRNVF